MSQSDPMTFAALASRMSDDELARSIFRFGSSDNLSEYQLALLDEARLRRLFGKSVSGCNEKVVAPQGSSTAARL